MANPTATALVPFPVASFARGSLKNRGNYDLCSHPFHSWRCVRVTKRGKSLFSHQINSPEKTIIEFPISFKPLRATVTPSPLQTKFPSQSVKPEQSERLDKMISAVPVSTAMTPVYDKCSHPFHRWLCQRARKRVLTTESSKILITTNSTPESITTDTVATSTIASTTTTTTNKPITTSIKNTVEFVNTIPSPKPKDLFGPDPKLGKSLISSKTTNLFPSTQKTPIKSKEYDKCSHSFHAWLCRIVKSSKPKGNPNVPANIGKSLISNPNKDSSKLSVSDTSTTRKPKIKETSPYDMCNHAFHSWLCPKSQPQRKTKHAKSTSHSEVSFKKPKSITNISPNDNIQLVTLKPTIKPTEKSYIKCNHAFHSWLCDKNPSSKNSTLDIRNKEHSPSNIFKSLKIESEKEPDKIASPRPDRYDRCTYSFHSWICRSSNRSKVKDIRVSSTTFIPPTTTTTSTTTTTTTTPTTTTIKPVNIAKSLHNGKTEHYHICSHPFHSWRCPQKSKSDDSQELKTKASSFQNSTKKNVEGETTERPESKAKSLFPQKFSNMFQTKEKNAWKGANPCTHAFHSWLCQSLRPRLTKSISQAKSLLEITPQTTSPSPSPPTTTEKVVQSTSPQISSFKSRTGLTGSSSQIKTCNHPFHRFSFDRNRTRIPASRSLRIHERRKDNVVKQSFPSHNQGKKLLSTLPTNKEFRIVPSMILICRLPNYTWICGGPTHNLRLAAIAPLLIPNISNLPLENEQADSK